MLLLGVHQTWLCCPQMPVQNWSWHKTACITWFLQIHHRIVCAFHVVKMSQGKIFMEATPDFIEQTKRGTIENQVDFQYKRSPALCLV